MRIKEITLLGDRIIHLACLLFVLTTLAYCAQGLHFSAFNLPWASCIQKHSCGASHIVILILLYKLHVRLSNSALPHGLNTCLLLQLVTLLSFLVALLI